MERKIKMTTDELSKTPLVELLEKCEITGVRTLNSLKEGQVGGFIVEYTPFKKHEENYICNTMMPTSNLLKEKKKTADNEQVMEILLKQLELLSEYSQKYLANIDSAAISLAMKDLAEVILNYNSSSEKNHPQD